MLLIYPIAQLNMGIRITSMMCDPFIVITATLKTGIHLVQVAVL